MRDSKGHFYALAQPEACFQGTLPQHTPSETWGPAGFLQPLSTNAGLFFLPNCKNSKLEERRRQKSVIMEKTHVDNGERNSLQSAQGCENLTVTHPIKNNFQMSF